MSPTTYIETRQSNKKNAMKIPFGEVIRPRRGNLLKIRISVENFLRAVGIVFYKSPLYRTSFIHHSKSGDETNRSVNDEKLLYISIMGK